MRSACWTLGGGCGRAPLHQLAVASPSWNQQQKRHSLAGPGQPTRRRMDGRSGWTVARLAGGGERRRCSRHLVGAEPLPRQLLMRRTRTTKRTGPRWRMLQPLIRPRSGRARARRGRCRRRRRRRRRRRLRPPPYQQGQGARWERAGAVLSVQALLRVHVLMLVLQLTLRQAEARRRTLRHAMVQSSRRLPPLCPPWQKES